VKTIGSAICYCPKVLHALLACLTVILFCSIFLELYQEIDKDGYIYIYMRINDVNIRTGKEQNKNFFMVL
jgi:hypothetical protein